MFESLKITNFKGFRETELPSLGRVNLITGGNNVGKTSLLEAVALCTMPPTYNVVPTLFRSATSGQQTDYWRWIFSNANPDRSVSLDMTSAVDTAKVCFTSPTAPRPAGTWATYPPFGDAVMHISANRFTSYTAISTRPGSFQDAVISLGAVQRKTSRSKLEALMRLIDPRCKSIEPIALPSGHTEVHVDVGLGEMVPAGLLGEGFNRLLRIYSDVLASDAQVLLIDEIENGIHHSAMETVWRGIKELARERGVQVFATTHSYECLSAAVDAFAGDAEQDFRMIRLERDEPNDNIRAVTIQGEQMVRMIENRFEVR